MQFSQQQKATMFQLRRNYLSQVASLSKRRQHLLHQLNSLPDPMQMTVSQLASRNIHADDLNQQLQELLADEQQAYMQYLRVMGHKVISLRHNLLP